jgi:hypothetical protein
MSDVVGLVVGFAVWWFTLRAFRVERGDLLRATVIVLAGLVWMI